MGKATNLQFCSHRLNRNKIPLKNSGKVAVGVVRDTGKFSGHPYMAHRAVILLLRKIIIRTRCKVGLTS